MICPARNVPKAVTMDMGWECVVSVRTACKDCCTIPVQDSRCRMPHKK